MFGVNTALGLILLVNLILFILASLASLEPSFAERIFGNAFSGNHVVKAESYSTKVLFIWASYYCHKNLFTDGSLKRAFLFYARPSEIGFLLRSSFTRKYRNIVKIIYHHGLFFFLICGGWFSVLLNRRNSKSAPEVG